MVCLHDNRLFMYVFELSSTFRLFHSHCNSHAVCVHLCELHAFEQQPRNIENRTEDEYAKNKEFIWIGVRCVEIESEHVDGDERP